ncbi:MAG: hypothetical protein ACK5JT_16890, partial [Hyphomicrobiaceae bacterium]
MNQRNSAVPPLPESGRRKAKQSFEIKPESPLAKEPEAAPGKDDTAPDSEKADDQQQRVPSRRTARRRPAGPPRTHVAANDDLPSIGGLIFALHQKPSQRPMQIAAIASAVWAFCSLLLGWAMLAPEIHAASSVTDFFVRPTAIILAATIILPIAVFWFIAMLVWRAQELKLMSSAMTEVAIRLAEPDRMAEQQVASVGQAVRRQVNHMNEAVARALGRAGELEALVHNEVASLEHSYTQNENRIRGLLDELAGERTALLNTSERVSFSLKELGTDIPSLIDKLGEQQVKLARFIEQAGVNLVSMEQSLTTGAGHLAESVGARTQELRGVLTEQTANLQGLLESRSSEIATALTGGVGRIETALDGHAENIQSVFDNFTGGLDSALGQRTDDMREMIEGTVEGLDRALEHRTDDMKRSLVGAAETVSNHIAQSASSLETVLGERTNGLQTILEEYTKALDATMESRQQSLDDQLISRTKALDDAFSERLQLVDETMLKASLAIDSSVADK